MKIEPIETGELTKYITSNDLIFALKLNELIEAHNESQEPKTLEEENIAHNLKLLEKIYGDKEAGEANTKLSTLTAKDFKETGVYKCGKCPLYHSDQNPHTAKPQATSYGFRDHTHCPEKDSPCGMKGKHHCCLCGTEPQDKPKGCGKCDEMKIPKGYCIHQESETEERIAAEMVWFYAFYPDEDDGYFLLKNKRNGQSITFSREDKNLLLKSLEK